MNSANLMQKKLPALLAKELPGIEPSILQQVADVIIGRQISCSIDQLVTSLLASNIGVGQLVAALLRCEWISVQQLIATHGSEESDARQVERFSRSIEHFNSLQEAIITAADRNWRESMDVESRDEELEDCHHEWLQSGRVYLHNYFEEMPVSTRARFIEYSDGILWMEANDNLARVFCVSPRMNSALISTPDRMYNFHVRAQRFEQGRVGARIGAIERAERERRRDLRVRLDTPLKVVLKTEIHQLQAEIIDISCGGIGIRIRGSKLVTDSAVLCSFGITGNVHFDDLAGLVCWESVTGAWFRAGIELKSDSSQRQALYRQVFAEEQKIIKRLRLFDMPWWMKEGTDEPAPGS
ncbi:PilZ domain-containing protein [Mariprofundus erugo]|uniref:PilZ domain-containing protein n=1 Tax=Mariprofundus erugo TaxID=2528639 RepID=A0A5R9GM65_9PROT|nr:PilZ domain-containing protein [Mariprofundus erugo]TLS67501.1 PilZ domain-containing protein [Mariprofundus erugo]TLS74468.1 PilZ domain-containing protein [Mariprofundus erugo]